MSLSADLFKKGGKILPPVISPNNLNLVSNNPGMTFKEFARTISIKSGNRYVSFELYPYQEQLIEDCQGKSMVFAVKSRQMGLTTLLACWFLYKAWCNPAYAAVVISKTQSDSSLIAKTIRSMANSSSLGITFSNTNTTELRLENGGVLYFKPLTYDSGRGIGSVQDVLLDEASFYSNPSLSEIQAAITPTTAMVEDSTIFVVSTPNGVNNDYYTQLTSNNPGIDILGTIEGMRAKELDPYQAIVIPSDGTYRESLKVIIHWSAHPLYGSKPNFLEQKAKERNMSLESVEQEYDLSFLVDNTSYFEFEKLKRCLYTDCVRKNNLYTDHDVHFDHKYHHFRSTHCMFVDPSGSGKDYFTALVFDVRDPVRWILVDHYYVQGNAVDKDTHIECLAELCKKYTVAGIIYEDNGVGSLIEVSLTPKLKQNKLNPFIYAHTTTSKTKEANLEKLKHNFEQGRFVIYGDCPFWEEARSFIRKGARLQAAPGKTDDSVLAMSFTSIWFDNLPIAVQKRFDGGQGIRKEASQKKLKWQRRTGAISYQL
jgi:hypothetical protein